MVTKEFQTQLIWESIKEKDLLQAYAAVYGLTQSISLLRHHKTFPLYPQKFPASLPPSVERF